MLPRHGCASISSDLLDLLRRRQLKSGQGSRHRTSRVRVGPHRLNDGLPQGEVVRRDRERGAPHLVVLHELPEKLRSPKLAITPQSALMARAMSPKLQGLVDVVKLVPCPVRDQGRQAASAFSLGLRTHRSPPAWLGQVLSGVACGSMP